jgi:RNA polymerase sigma-70 factor, ECF subfamily
VSAVVKAIAPDLLAYFERRVNPPEDAADLLGETLLIGWRRASAIPADAERARMWFFVTARNVLANYRRGVRRRSEVADRLRTEVHRVSRLETAVSWSGTPVAEAISALPEELAELVRLVHWDGFSLVEAAQLLGVGDSTGRSRYARARVLLSQALTEASSPGARRRSGT